MANELDLNDQRVEYIADYVIKTFRCKSDKFGKMYALEEQKLIYTEFFEKNDRHQLIVLQTAAGALTTQFDWPTSLKSKACYFVRKTRDQIGKDANMRAMVTVGDISYSPVDQLSVLVEEVLMPIFSNERNLEGWPHVVYEDVLRHVDNLRNSAYVVAGQVKGKTMLPVPSAAYRINDDTEFDK